MGHSQFGNASLDRKARPARSLARMPTASGAVLRLAAARIRDAGQDAEALLKANDLAALVLDDRAARVGAEAQIRFLDAAARALKDDWLGFHLARDVDLRSAGRLYYAVASAARLGEGLERLQRYGRVTNEAVQVTYSNSTECTLTIAYSGVSRHLDRHQIEFIMTLLLRVCRSLTGRQLIPHRVSFVHHRKVDASPMKPFFNSEIEYGGWNDELAFAASAHDLPLVSADTYLSDLMQESCEEILARRASNMSALRTTVENILAPMLPHAKTQSRDVARRLGLSGRTFARRLAAEGTTYGEILDQLRHELAMTYLSERDLQVSQIAWLLGFHEVSALTHACRRWTGKTPREVRASLVTT
ncbi:AraC family transcriptional regulator [Microvirga sesbaniae]|uniref:AraC family transcriptional regulator n=1 Tax=Microvirga sesbaniae TaxID=681392 RepID=UPI0021C59E65|nr:AraC family transcriptional regulator [Microvirga sp. HBU67692]